MSSASSGDQNSSDSIQLRDVLRILRTHWVGATSVALIFVCIAGAWTIMQPRVWTSTASGLVQALSGGDSGQALAAENLAQSRAETYLSLATSQAVAEAAAEALGKGNPAALLDQVDVSRADNSAILAITARAASPAGARDLADAWLEALAAQVDLLENPEGVITSQAVSFVPLSAATTPKTPSSPDLTAALTVGLLAGLVAGAVTAFVLHHLDRRIRSSEQVEREIGVPVVGTIVEYESLRGKRELAHRVADTRGEGRRAHFAILEALRELRTNLSYLSIDSPPRSLVIVSATPGEGKSTLAANLADTIAATGERVVVIDCDLRKPTQAEIFHLEAAVGLTDVLSGRAPLAAVTQRVAHRDSLSLLASGATPPNPSEMLASRAMKDLVGELTRQGSFVILDAPPVLAVTDGALLATVADGVIVAVNTKATTRDQLQRVSSAVRKVGGNLMGVVLNRVPMRGPDAQSFGYYGSSYYYASSSAGTDSDQAVSGRTPHQPVSPGRRHLRNRTAAPAAINEQR